MKLIAKLSEIITNPDSGRLSMTKLAAATGHLNAAGWFAWLTYRYGFMPELWVIYLGATIVHNGYNKAVNTLRDIKINTSSSEPPER